MQLCNFSLKGAKESKKGPQLQPIFKPGTPVYKVDELPFEPNATEDSATYCLSGTTPVYARDLRTQFRTKTFSIHSSTHVAVRSGRSCASRILRKLELSKHVAHWMQ
jgi:hypothetical protein